jgi:ribose transport system substrate-binding protein
MSEGVKVALVDTGLANPSGIVSSITSNNIQGGEAAGEVIGERLHGHGDVSWMSLSATATTQVQRLQGGARGAQEGLSGGLGRLDPVHPAGADLLGDDRAFGDQRSPGYRRVLRRGRAQR